MAHTASTQQMTLQVHDTEGHTYSVLLRVDEKAAQGTLMIAGSAAGETRQYELTQLQKSRNGKTLGALPTRFYGFESNPLIFLSIKMDLAR